MKELMVTYTVKKEDIETVKKAIEEFISAIKEHEPGTLRYDVHHHVNTFVHFMSFADEKSDLFHRGAEHTKKFVSTIYPLCEVEPEFTQLEIVNKK